MPALLRAYKCVTLYNMQKGLEVSPLSLDIKDRIMCFHPSTLNIPLQPWQRRGIVSGIRCHGRARSQTEWLDLKMERNNFVTSNKMCSHRY